MLFKNLLENIFFKKKDSPCEFIYLTICCNDVSGIINLRILNIIVTKMSPKRKDVIQNQLI